MCGIAGYFNQADAEAKVAKSLKVLEARGRDGSGVETRDDCSVGHLLHAVVGSVKQPLKGKGVLVANCEIYNWKEIAAKEEIEAKNDAELLLKLLDKMGVPKALELIDGDYAFAYWIGDEVYLARDILGVKPLWLSGEDGFSFASEKKALRANGKRLVGELNPRSIVVYNIGDGKARELPRKFFSTEPEVTGDASYLGSLIEEAVRKRLPDKRVGVLFSGGIDSSLVAYLLKRAGADVVLYSSGLQGSKDREWAKLFAEKMGMELRCVEPSMEEVERELSSLVPLIEDNNVVKVSVGLTISFACKAAVKDGIKVIFSGNGSDEIFAGYSRHKLAYSLNKDCLSSLLKIYEVNNYRDDVITMEHGLEVRVPFLDKRVVEYGLRIKAEDKIRDGVEKFILRKAAEGLGLPEEFVWRKKAAAQYGSGFDKAVEKLAKKSGFRTKSDYLRKFYMEGNLRLGALYSSGKDSNLALYTMQRQNYEISCLVVLKSLNPYSYMFHTPAVELAKLQAKALGLPIVWKETKGVKEEELKELEEALAEAKKEHGIEGVVSGALYSNYQRTRIEEVCEKLGLKSFSPLWHSDQEQEMRQLLRDGFEVWLTSVAADGLDESWLGRRIGMKDVDKLVEISKRNRLNVAGEGGEFESLVLDGPNFSKRIELEDFEIVKDGSSATLVVKKAKLVGKQY